MDIDLFADNATAMVSLTDLEFDVDGVMVGLSAVVRVSYGLTTGAVETFETPADADEVEILRMKVVSTSISLSQEDRESLGFYITQTLGDSIAEGILDAIQERSSS